MSTLTELAQSTVPKSFELVNALDGAAIARHLELLFLERGFANEAAVTEDSDKTNIVWNFAYNVTLSALDIAKTKVEEAEAGPTKAKFRDEVKYFEALLLRLSKRAGIDEDCGCGSGSGKTQTFLIGKVPFIPACT